MKPFDLEKAELGEHILCCGTQAKFVAYEPEAAPYEQVIYLAHGNQIFTSAVNGLSEKHQLTMAPKKRTVWVNFYGDSIASYYETQEDADKASCGIRIGKAYPVKVEE